MSPTETPMGNCNMRACMAGCMHAHLELNAQDTCALVDDIIIGIAGSIRSRPDSVGHVICHRPVLKSPSRHVCCGKTTKDKKYVAWRIRNHKLGVYATTCSPPYLCNGQR